MRISSVLIIDEDYFYPDASALLSLLTSFLRPLGELSTYRSDGLCGYSGYGGFTFYNKVKTIISTEREKAASQH